MKSVAIFRHTILQVTGNLPAIVKLWVWPTLLALVAGTVIVASSMSLTGSIPANGENVSPEQARALFLAVFIRAALLIAVVFFTACWAATGWHRHVLLNERVALFAKPRWRIILLYALQMLLAGLALIPVTMVFSVVISLLISAEIIGPGYLPLWLQLPFAIAAGYVVLRLSVPLPAIAIGKARPSLRGWQMTKGKSADILGLATIMALIQLAMSAVLYLLLQIVWSPTLSLIGEMLIATMITIVTLSLLTTLYGHYVEGRPLR